MAWTVGFTGLVPDHVAVGGTVRSSGSILQGFELCFAFVDFVVIALFLCFGFAFEDGFFLDHGRVPRVRASFHFSLSSEFAL